VQLDADATGEFEVLVVGQRVVYRLAVRVQAVLHADVERRR
jgi:hypothetical protein